MNLILKEIFFSRLYVRVYLLAISFIAALFGLAGPFFQKQFIDGLLGRGTELNGLYFLALSFFSLLLAQGLNFYANYLGACEALVLQKSLSEKLYDKILRLKSETLTGRSIGEIVALYTTDISGATIFLDQTLPSGASTIFPLIMAPIALWWFYHFPPFWVTGVMGLVILGNTILAFRQSKYFYLFKQLAAVRTGLVGEWIQNMRTLRILGWLEAFESKIFRVRELETDNRVAMVSNGQFMNAISSSVTFLMNLLGLFALIQVREDKATPGELLSLLWIMGVFLTRPFRQMPWFFTFGFDGYTSVKRLSQFMQIENKGNLFPNFTETQTEAQSDFIQQGLSLKVTNLNLILDGKKILDQISLNISANSLVAVIGEVGAGKSALFMSLLGETSATFDSYVIGGKSALELNQAELLKYYSFSPQVSFIMSATLRENVAFEYDVQPDIDPITEKSLRGSQFYTENEPMTTTLDSLIGERGVNLSGGQRQRVNLARSDFHLKPIVLLDDSMSAVDVKTEQQLMTQLLKGQWAERTRILSSHRLSVLKQVDEIFFMKDGKIAAHGPFGQLTENSDFNEFIKSLNRTKEQESVNS